MYRARLSLAFAALVALVCIQAAFVYWGANRVNDYAQHSRLASDIQAELLDLSANKQRLRVWAMQRLMNTDAQPEQRERLVASMYTSAANLDDLVRRDLALWTELVRREGVSMPAEVPQLVGVTELLRDNIQAVEARLAQLVPLERGADFPALWSELTQVFDMARGRDLRELINGAIAHQRAAVPVARAATERGLDVLRAQAIGMALVTLAVAVVLALHLKRRLQRPLDRLLEGTQALQAGALDHRVATGSNDEFDRVAQHFNAMAAELQQHRARADAARRGLEDAVQARTQELSAAHDTLQRLDQRRRQLFADLGHELRTPATSIRGEAEIALRGGDKPADEYRQTLARIVGGVDQLTRVIHDLLLIAKAEADQLVMHPAPVDLRALLGDAAEQAAALGAPQGVQVQLLLDGIERDGDASGALPTGQVTVLADADRLRQALVIVLDNAVRYSARGTTVRIGLQGVAGANGVGEVAVVVRDEGIGIDADELPRVFERFVRGRRARAHRADGTGIGLSIAQGIVQVHQGRITIASVPQQGTVVRIELPLVMAPPQQIGAQQGALV
ncbi:cell wall metabolism sensor histidine kinase WalK [Acidovorax sp. ACV01]|uniref:sensor histidine kinase n=1 Tax=Acidovorax sp. ACV01 TaxID=2769311 RepID=UPI00177CE558|nr:HAMP domain-containing sensor histidine kinase [Acidovorax sp. ACV01]MBD9390768.1 HAMP domain-containing histidine kinase [Acidovorax sp. ACV01]